MFLVTSGCSFSDNIGKRWPHYLADALSLKLFNRGQGSCGNDWIAKTAIYQTQLLLNDGVNPKDILVAVMWSGIDRKGLFISSKETDNYDNLINSDTYSSNPINFIDSQHNKCTESNKDDGYLI
jgi:hypothetical protein